MNAPASIPNLSVTEVLKEDFAIDPDIWVSPYSRYRDPVWDFRSPGQRRKDAVSQAKLVIAWDLYTTPLNERQFRKGGKLEGHLLAQLSKGLVEDLKVLAFFSLRLLPSTFASRGNQSSKPNTVVPAIRAVVCLLSDVIASYDKLLEDRCRPPLIDCVGDMTLEDLRDAVAESPRVDGDKLANYLRRLTHPIVRKHLKRQPEWNRHDLASIDFKRPEKRDDYTPVMPDELFRLLSDSACADVKGFLRLLQMEPVDKHPSKPPTFAHSAGPMLFEQYIKIRETDREETARLGRKRNNCSRKERELLERWFGVTTEAFQQYLARVQRAAFMLIGMYTGGRYSDLGSFRDGCVGERYGMQMLIGTEVKRRSVDAPEDEDIWPAIPIMLDAVACLKEVSRVTFNPYLVSPTYTVGVGEEPQPLSYGGFIGAMNLYLQEVDEPGRWSKTRLSANYLRHTLAYNLGRLGVNPVYISIQLKHLDDAFRILPSDVTLGYGSSGELALLKATGAERASLKAAEELFSVNAPIAGGGAEAFRRRKKAYFEGQAAAGRTEKEVIERLAKHGLPFVNVGGGYCGGKREILLKDGTKQLPPCLGQLGCNPKACHQAVITRTHAPHWHAIHRQNSELLKNPAMAHASHELQAAVKTATEVLTDLGLPVAV